MIIIRASEKRVLIPKGKKTYISNNNGIEKK
jgi:hypothetical protein